MKSKKVSAVMLSTRTLQRTACVPAAQRSGMEKEANLLSHGHSLVSKFVVVSSWRGG